MVENNETEKCTKEKAEITGKAPREWLKVARNIRNKLKLACKNFKISRKSKKKEYKKICIYL